MSGSNEAAAPGATASRLVTIRNQRGLHARAAAKLVKLADQFDAEVTVVKGDMVVSGRSIMGLMMLAAGPGSEIGLRATGMQAEAALTAIAALIAGKFDED
ncbi:HPr family phosphocarrier protein [Rhodospirillaceae bacterium SYSU D60014]|uniref:HPr family phosphocarrier protein n=1 Tax=Virgifigura deserti TaxID=2268457 RepID=UPI000E6639D9